MSEKTRTNWTQIIVTALLTGALTVVGGVVIYYITQQKAELRYSIANADPFYGSSAATTIYKLRISNTGQKEVDNFTAAINFPYEKVSDHRVSATGGATITEKLDQNSDLITSDVLNPGDHIDASYLVTFDHLPTEPEVSVRGRGVTGTKVSTDIRGTGDRLWFLLMAGSVVGFSVMSSLATQLVRRVAQGKGTGSSSHASSRRDVLAFGFFSVGLVKEGERILQLRKCHYWSQSDRIAATYLTSADPKEKIKAARALETALDYSPRIADTSVPIINYNIAALWLSAGEKKPALERLKIATSSESDFVRKRLERDETMKSFALEQPDAIPNTWRRSMVDGTVAR